MLQEVDASWFDQHWAPAMSARGYNGFFTRKRHKSSSEGVATFVRSGAFELIEARPLSLSLDARDAPAAVVPLLEAHTSTADGVSKLPTVAQLLLLREVAPSSPSPRHLLVANTHLYFSNPGMHVRLMQTAKVLEHAHELAAKVPAAPALILAGDLNSDSTDAAVRLLTAGIVEADNPDWLHGALNWAPSLDLPAAARVVALDAAAALSVCVDADPSCTGVDSDVEAVWAQQLNHAEAADLVLVGAVAASLFGARRIARELHLLRRAIERLLARAPASHQTAETEDVTELHRLAGAIVSDAAAGRSLFNSEALAAAE
eukprot:807762-Prymnesium_polylepis.2